MANKTQNCIIQISEKCKKRQGEWLLKDFYMATNKKMFVNKRVPICKECFRQYVYNDDGSVNIDKFKHILRIIDVPFYQQEFETAIEQSKETIGVYMRAVLLNHKNESWIDVNIVRNKIQDKQQKISKSDISIEVLNRWGDNWKPNNYAQLEKFYHAMKIANKVETPQKEDYIKKLARLSIKLDEAIECGESQKAKQLGDLYSKYMTDSKLREMDMSDEDKQGGIRTFSQIYAEVEKDDFIPPWKKYMKIKNLTQDVIDKTIMHIENFTLRFNKAERMTEPPLDTPKAKKEELDNTVVKE